MGPSAWAQTPRTRAELLAQVSAQLASGQAITAAQLRAVLADVVASAHIFGTDGTAVTTSGTYANPSWLSSLAWTKVTGVPTSLSLLGISGGAALDTIGANGSAYYLARANHTGDQAIATVTGLQAALDAKLAASGIAADVNPAGTAIAAALAGKAAASHPHVATAISDSTATGRAVLTAADAAAARTAIGAGTSSFSGAYTDLSGKPTLGDAAAKNTGTGSGEVAAGNHTHSGTYEPALGNPASDNYVLSSSASGVRAWIPTSGGSGGTKTYAVFRATDGDPPATNYATFDTRNSIPVLAFDKDTDEAVVFSSVMPEAAALGSGLKVRLHVTAPTATSGVARWAVKLERMTTDLDADSWDTAAEADLTVSGTSGIIATVEITLTTIDSVTAGDPYRLHVSRNADHANDTLTEDAQLILVEVRSGA